MPEEPGLKAVPASRLQLDELEGRVDRWAQAQVHDNPAVAAVERGEPGERRWYVRVHGEEKAVFTVWFTLRQRALHVETYMMPAPEENHAELFEHLLRRNAGFRGLAFSVGMEDGVYLTGQVPVEWVDEVQLDRLLGTTYAYVEQCFRPAMRIGYRSKFRS